MTDITFDLKHGTGSNANIVLAPQPSEDPNDPLNWSRWKKEVVFMTLNYAAVLCASVVAPLLNPATVVLAGVFDTSITAIVVISGYLLLVTGCSGLRTFFYPANLIVLSIVPYLESSANVLSFCLLF